MWPKAELICLLTMFIEYPSQHKKTGSSAQSPSNLNRLSLDLFLSLLEFVEVFKYKSNHRYFLEWLCTFLVSVHYPFTTGKLRTVKLIGHLHISQISKSRNCSLCRYFNTSQALSIKEDMARQTDQHTHTCTCTFTRPFSPPISVFDSCYLGCIDCYTPILGASGVNKLILCFPVCSPGCIYPLTDIHRFTADTKYLTLNPSPGC